MRFIPLAVGGFTMLATAAGSAATQISPDWTVDLRTVAAVGAVVLSGTWWLSSRLRGFSDRLREGDARFSKFEQCFEQIQNRLDRLPCHNPQAQDCPSGKIHPKPPQQA